MDDIHKIQLSHTTHQEFACGPQFRPLCIQMQGKNPCVWYETQLPVVHSHRAGFWLIGTGSKDLDKVPAHALYIGTVQIPIVVGHDSSMDEAPTRTEVYHCYWTHYKVRA